MLLIIELPNKILKKFLENPINPIKLAEIKINKKMFELKINKLLKMTISHKNFAVNGKPEKKIIEINKKIAKIGVIWTKPVNLIEDLVLKRLIKQSIIKKNKEDKTQCVIINKPKINSEYDEFSANGIHKMFISWTVV